MVRTPSLHVTGRSNREWSQFSAGGICNRSNAIRGLLDNTECHVLKDDLGGNGKCCKQRLHKLSPSVRPKTWDGDCLAFPISSQVLAITIAAELSKAGLIAKLGDQVLAIR